MVTLLICNMIIFNAHKIPGIYILRHGRRNLVPGKQCLHNCEEYVTQRPNTLTMLAYEDRPNEDDESSFTYPSFSYPTQR